MTKDNFWKDADVIYSYTDEQAIEDGVIVPVAFGSITRVTNTVMQDFFDGETFDTSKFNAFMETACVDLDKQRQKKEDRFYSAIISDSKYFIVDNGAGFTLMKPEDY